MTRRSRGDRTPPPEPDDEPTIDEARPKGEGGASRGKTLPDADAPRIPGGMRLRAESGACRGWEGALRPGEALTIGRNADNSLVLADDFISRKHCMIVECGDRWMVFDLGSENGTYLNGTRVEAGELRPGCFVRVGSTANPTIIRVTPEDEQAPTARGGLLGKSAGMLRVFNLIDRYGPSDESVMIFGESGTGKEGIARALHDASERKGRFVEINCGALPEQLMESELFGHKKGAFSGADSDKIGLFEAANGGTIFLDEIGELPMALQPKLLRVLEARTIRPLGTNHERPIDVRVVSATNCDLRTPDRPIRIDLYNRLAVLLIHVPPAAAAQG